MPTRPFLPSPALFNRRCALLAGMGLLAWPAARLAAAPAALSPSPSGVWPRALAVPGGIARLSLGPA
ncbi:MAG: M23 family peptidase, partial [Polaromonas sp.]|nr:M23 family peptidase [Polaromonas sp.]